MIRDALYKRKDQDIAALLGDQESVSYKELALRAAKLQTVFPDTSNQHIAAIFMSDETDFLASLFAVLQAGWTAFPLNDRLSSDELSDLLCYVPVQLILTSENLKQKCQNAISLCITPPQIVSVNCFYNMPQTSSEIKTVDPDTPMLLLSSSGTTGRVKLVQLSERNIAFTVHAYLEHMGYEKYQDPDPRYALGTPLFGIYGLLITFSCIIRGFPLLPMANNFTLDKLYRSAQEHSISHYDGGTLAAVLMDQTLGRPIPYDISTLRYFGFGGSKAPEGTLERLSAAFPQIRFWSGYGMTEASPLIAQPFQGLPADKLASVGLPLPGIEVLLKTEEGTTSEPDKLGEIIARGPNIMIGYYNNREATDEVLHNGWLHTGDIGYFDKDGYLYICGRKKNMILVRGFNVFPEEIETRLLNSALVKDCLIYYQTDKPGTETVCADIIPSGPEITTEMIYRWCEEHLADYKRPQHIRLTKTLEKTSTGKTKRSKE